MDAPAANPSLRPETGPTERVWPSAELPTTPEALLRQLNEPLANAVEATLITMAVIDHSAEEALGEIKPGCLTELAVARTTHRAAIEAADEAYESAVGSILETASKKRFGLLSLRAGLDKNAEDLSNYRYEYLETHATLVRMKTTDLVEAELESRSLAVCEALIEEQARDADRRYQDHSDQLATAKVTHRENEKKMRKMKSTPGMTLEEHESLVAEGELLFRVQDDLWTEIGHLEAQSGSILETVGIAHGEVNSIRDRIKQQTAKIAGIQAEIDAAEQRLLDIAQEVERIKADVDKVGVTRTQQPDETTDEATEQQSVYDLQLTTRTDIVEPTDLDLSQTVNRNVRLAPAVSS